ncbi:beta strand repeat-containing protein [Fructobacillus pseudoficulneus]|uniref:beta strand repeat-containing protein n=1 Tax=Fructobacillus pseudoficulneus TaxID=220714 RepID=UPI000750F4E1|nr:DUF1542 domain-containing protein [Fructobacillus pseudoficulneus]SEH46192.1 protein of unknown function [Fructobacillus pseudoficulneus]
MIDAPKYFNVGARDATYGSKFAGDGSWNSAIYNFGANASLTINNADVQAFESYQSSTTTPTQNLVRGGTLVVNRNGATMLNRAGNAVHNTGAGTTRELLAQNDGLGQVFVEYIDQNGQMIRKVQVPLTADNVVGQRILLNGTEYAINQMPDGYMWALGSEIPTTAANDAQSGGDPTTADDNGDKSGQPTVAIIPDSQFTNTYKIYVYGKPETVQYQYVDENTHKVVPGPLGQTGTEDAQGLATANYGHTIDWTNSYYTATNVPNGYHYDQSNKDQPGQMTVSDNNNLVTIYIAGNSQNITPIYQTKDGQTITPDQSQTIDGITGQTLLSLPQPSASGYAIYQTLVNGAVVDPTQPYTFGPDDTITFVYQTNADRIADLTAQIEDAETAANTVINNDQTLSTKEKGTQTSRTAAIRQSALIDLNNTTGNGLNDIAKTAIANIQAVHMSNLPVDQQQANLLKKLSALAQQTKTSISTDKTILDANRGGQSDNVDTDAAAGLKAISAATDIDSIDDAYDTYSQKIAADHQSGDPIATQQANALKSINQSAQNVINAIQNDPTLDSSQQANQVGLVNADKNSAINAVNQAVNADQIATQVNNSTSFATHHTQGESVANRQADAKAIVDGLVVTAKQKISNDTGLNDAQKAQQNQNLTEAANVMYTAINQATTADQINAAQNNQSNQQAITKAYVPAATSLSQQQQNAQAQVADWAKTITGQIQSDTSLESTTQNAQVGQVKGLAAQVAGQITKTEDAQQLLNLLAGTQSGVSVHDQLVALHVPGTALSDRINQAKTALQVEAQKISALISKDQTLLETNRSSQLNNISTYLNTANTSITNSANADAVNQNLADDLKNLDAIYVPGDPISTQQQNAIKKLAAKAADVQQNKIGADTNLNNAQKQYQNGLINQVVAAATTDINSKTTAQTIWDREVQAEQTVAAQYEAGSIIQSAQQAALTTLQQANTNVTANINGETTLSNVEKQQQLAQLAVDYQAAQGNVNTAISSAAATAAGTSGQTTMSGDFHTGKAVADRQTDADANLQQTYKQIVAAISGDVTLTTADKNQQGSAAQSAYNRAVSAVNSATTAQAVIDQLTSGNTAITATYKTGANLDDQRGTAKGQLDSENARILAAINTDPTLLSSDRASQKGTLATAYGNAVSALNRATDAQGILDAEQAGITSIDGTHQSLTSVADRKQAAQKALDQENGRVQQLINDDASLLTSAKNNQLAQLLQAYQQAQSNINQAQDADSVLSAQTTGVNSLAPNHTSGTPFAQQQTSAEQAITDAQSTADQAVDGDASLLTTEKAAQKQIIDDAASQAQSKLQVATTAQTLVDVTTPALTTINGAHQTGQDVTGRRNNALAALQAENQKIANAITADPNLLTSEQNSQLANLATAYKAAQDALAATSAPDAQNIVDALTTDLSRIDAQHTAGQMTLAARIADAQSQLQNQNSSVASAVQTDPTLTTSEQNTQTATVNQAYTAANNQVGVDTTAQAVANDLASGLTAISNSHKSGESLSKQQEDRINQLKTQDGTAKSTITSDPTLLTQEQNTQTEQVDTYYQNAVSEIQAAQNAQSVLTIYNSAVTQINGVHQTGVSLESQKDGALAKLKAVNDQTNTAITSEPTLTTAQQAAEVAS